MMFGIGCMREGRRAAHPVIVSVEAQQVLIILLLLAAGAGQAVIPWQAPLYAMLFDPARVITFDDNEQMLLLKIVTCSLQGYVCDQLLPAQPNVMELAAAMERSRSSLT